MYIPWFRSVEIGVRPLNKTTMQLAEYCNYDLNKTIRLARQECNYFVCKFNFFRRIAQLLRVIKNLSFFLQLGKNKITKPIHRWIWALGVANLRRGFELRKKIAASRQRIHCLFDLKEDTNDSKD